MARDKTPGHRRGRRIPYDVTGVRPREPVPLHEWRNGAEASEDVAPDSFTARVVARRVDLVALVKEGIPPRSYHAHSEGMLVRGKRHMWHGATGDGKSLVCLVHAVRMALAGERIVLLDRENGADEYADRLSQIMDSWRLTEARRATLQRNLSYYEYPTLKSNDAVELVRYLDEELAADMVVFDSQRMFLTDYGLSERDTDDYSLFMSYAIDPLHQARITTLILDNAGHADPHRPRGTSSKRDLNEVLFELKKVQDFDRRTPGAVQLEVKKSRFGDRGTWRMAIGGGMFGEWQSDDDRVIAFNAAKPDLKPTIYAVLREAGRPVGVNKLLRLVRERDLKFGSPAAKRLLREWARDSEEPLRHVKEVYVVAQ